MTTTPTLFRFEQRANTSDVGPGGDDQREPQIVGLANGNFVVLWEDNSDVTDGDDGTDIIGQLYSAEGDKIGGEFQANNNRILDDEGDFTAAALPNGNFVIVYEDTDANGTSIVFDIKDPTGAQVSSGTILNDPGADILGDPSVSVASDGSFLVTYQRQNATDVDTEVVKVSAAGVVGAPEVVISGSDSGFQTDAATLTNGNFVVVSRSGETDDAITFRILDPNGQEIPGQSAAFVANTFTNGETDSDPTVTALSGGGFVVSWVNTDANDTDVQFQIFNAAGTTVGGVGTVNSGGATDSNNEPEVIGLSDGGFVVVYDDDEANTVALQRFSATGAEVGTEVFVTDSGTETTPTVTLSDDGRLLVAWTTSTGSNSDVEVEIFDPRENVIDGDFTGETTTSRLDGATVNGLGGNDTLLGQDAADTLNGGDGDDVIRGRDGDDLIQGGFNADTIFGDGGDDLIFAFTQADPGGSGVADSISGGLGRDTLVGSNGDDVLRGNEENDVLIGGQGTDILRGNSGNDIYTVNVAGEAAEAANEGVDTVRTVVDYTLGANLERLQLLGGGNINGIGNTLDNRITGNGGANVLNGLGGDDLLTGGGGADRFVFNTALNPATNVDTIADFQVNVDEIRLDNADFAGLPVGALAAGAFRIGGAAADANDRVIYNQANGNLFFDADGAGGAAQTLFARLDPGLALDAGDFFVF